MHKLAKRTQIPAQPLAIAPNARSANLYEHRESATRIDFWQNEPNLRDPFNLPSKPAGAQDGELVREQAGEPVGAEDNEVSRRAGWPGAQQPPSLSPGSTSP